MKNNHLIRPAGQGNNCDKWSRNPNPDGPYLVRCRCRARHRLTLLLPNDAYQVKRCDYHAWELHVKVERGATFEILSDEEIIERPIPFLGEAMPAPEMIGEVGL